MRKLKSSLKSLNNSVFGFGPGFGLVLALAWPMLAQAEAIFHWVDANGVHHFSQSPPPDGSGEVRTMEVNGSQPASYDPEEDRYNLAAQEATMQARRDKLEESRKNQQQDQQPSTSSTIVYYPEPATGNQILYPPGYRPGFPHWPNRPKPPHHPDRPDGWPEKPGTLPEEEPPPASFPFRPLRSRD